MAVKPLEQTAGMVLAFDDRDPATGFSQQQRQRQSAGAAAEYQSGGPAGHITSPPLTASTWPVR